MMLNIGASEVIMIVLIFCLFINTDELPKIALKISNLFFAFKKHTSDLQFLVINNIKELKKQNNETLETIIKEKNELTKNFENFDEY